MERVLSHGFFCLFFWLELFLTQMEGLQTEGVVGCTDCKASWGIGICYFELYKRKLTWPFSWNLCIILSVLMPRAVKERIMETQHYIQNIPVCLFCLCLHRGGVVVYSDHTNCTMLHCIAMDNSHTAVKQYTHSVYTVDVQLIIM